MAELFQEFSQADARTTREYMVAPAVGSRSKGNLKTAKALGIDMPPTLLARADEVIE